MKNAPSPFRINADPTLQTHTLVYNTQTNSVLDVFWGVESISDIYFVIRGRLGGVWAAFPTFMSWARLWATKKLQDVALRQESGENTTKTTSDDEIDARNGFFTLILV